jgi:hypothetical protein
MCLTWINQEIESFVPVRSDPSGGSERRPAETITAASHGGSSIGIEGVCRRGSGSSATTPPRLSHPVLPLSIWLRGCGWVELACDIAGPEGESWEVKICGCTAPGQQPAAAASGGGTAPRGKLQGWALGAASWSGGAAVQLRATVPVPVAWAARILPCPLLNEVDRHDLILFTCVSRGSFDIEFSAKSSNETKINQKGK